MSDQDAHRREPDTKAVRTAMEIRRLVRMLVAATAILYVIMIGAAVYVYITAQSTHNSLCALRHDLERRVIASQNFLIEHPNGTPGIPPKLIKTSIRDQKKSIQALSNLSCGDG